MTRLCFPLILLLSIRSRCCLSTVPSPDLRAILDIYSLSVLEISLPVLREEGVFLETPVGMEYEVGKYEAPPLEPETVGEAEGEEQMVVLDEGEH